MDIIGLGIQSVLLAASIAAAGYLAVVLVVLLTIRIGDGIVGLSRASPEYWPLTIQTVLVAAAIVVLLLAAFCILWDWLAQAAGGPTPWCGRSPRSYLATVNRSPPSWSR